MPRTPSRFDRVMMTVYAVLVFLYGKLHVFFVGHGEKEAMKRFAIATFVIPSVVVATWKVFRVMPKETLKLIGKTSYWIFVHDEVGFWKGHPRFNRLDFMMNGQLLFMIGVAFAGMSLLPFEPDAPNWLGLKTVNGFLYESMNPYIAISMPFIGLMLAAVSAIKLPPCDWLALVRGRNPPPRPPGGREPRPEVVVANAEEPIRQAA
ncbi:MAG: hypothetical protein Q8P68_04775 [Candidatus Peregrinibacteria bacterium]|nr:hypothetical protein [Candidatus Peregrinibacteria bacterium]